MMEALSGAVSSLDSRDTSSTLASLLVRLALTQIQSHGPHRHSTPRPMELIIATTPQLNVTLAYLATAAPHLPQGPGSSYSLLATDHLSMLSNSPLVIEEFSQSKGVLDRSGVPTYGDALVAALGSGDRELWVNNKTRLVEDEKLNSSAWESISAMVLQGRGKGRAMFVLAALCVAGTVSQELQAKVVATRALYIASTLVQAAAAKHGRRIENVDRSTEAGIVAVFPTALLALACEHKVNWGGVEQWDSVVGCFSLPWDDSHRIRRKIPLEASCSHGALQVVLKPRNSKRTQSACPAVPKPQGVSRTVRAAIICATHNEKAHINNERMIHRTVPRTFGKLDTCCSHQ